MNVLIQVFSKFSVPTSDQVESVCEYVNIYNPSLVNYLLYYFLEEKRSRDTYKEGKGERVH
jgi:hypothetical protein